MKNRVKDSFKRVIIYFVLTIQALVIIFPILYIVLSSFKIRAEVFSTYLIFTPTLANFRKILFETNYFQVFKNSLLISLSTVVVTLLLAIPAAYGFSRFSFRAKDRLMFFVITTRMAPPTAFVVIYFIIFTKIGGVDKPITLVLLYTLMNLGFSIWLLKSFFDGVPREIEEAALVDGCNLASIFLRVILPLSTAGILVMGIFIFIYSWNEYDFALVLTRTSTKTLPVFVPQFLGVTYLEYEVMCAASTLALLPVIAGGIAMKKYLTRGLTMGAVKG